MRQTFGQWLREKRKAAGLTLVDLAAKARTFASVLSEIESSARRPSTDVAARLAKALKLEPSDFLARAGIVTPGALILLRQDTALVARLNRQAAADKALGYINASRAKRRAA